MEEHVKVVEFSAIGIIFFFGVVCNIIVIRSIHLTRSMRRTIANNMKNECINLLVLNLAVTDLLVLIVSIPMDVVAHYISWPYGSFACKFISPIQDICLTSSTLTFSAIAVERYLVARGVVHRGERNAKLAIAGIWLVSWLTMGLPLALYKTLITDEDMIICDVIWPNESVAKFFLFYMFTLILACALTGAIAYCGIRRNLSKVQQIQSKHTSQEDIHRTSNDSLADQALRISNLICVLVTVFVICVFPFPLFVVLIEMGVLAGFRYNYVLYLTTSCLLYGNCLANPLVLMFMSKDARAALTEKRSQTRRDATDHIRMDVI